MWQQLESAWPESTVWKMAHRQRQLALRDRSGGQLFTGNEYRTSILCPPSRQAWPASAVGRFDLRECSTVSRPFRLKENLLFNSSHLDRQEERRRYLPSRPG
jgi:hypothetical protein